jgi:hypothetical protein
MASDQTRAVNQAAYDLLKEEIDKSYPKGRFIALGGGRIIADAENFETMLSRLPELGWNPRDVMVVQAGREASGMILSPFPVPRR